MMVKKHKLMRRLMIVRLKMFVMNLKKIMGRSVHKK